MAVINLDAYLYLIFSDLIYLLQDTGIGVSTCTMPRDSKETDLGSHNQEASPSAGKITEVVLVSCCTRKCVPTAVSVHVVIPRVLECSLLQHMSSLRGSQILLQGLVSHAHKANLSHFYPIFSTQ